MHYLNIINYKCPIPPDSVSCVILHASSSLQEQHIYFYPCRFWLHIINKNFHLEPTIIDVAVGFVYPVSLLNQSLGATSNPLGLLTLSISSGHTHY